MANVSQLCLVLNQRADLVSALRSAEDVSKHLGSLEHESGDVALAVYDELIEAFVVRIIFGRSFMRLFGSRGTGKTRAFFH